MNLGPLKKERLRRCLVCNDMFFSGPAHRCPIRWVVWDAGAGDTETSALCDVYGHSAQGAAESWAERYLEHDEQTTIYNAEAVSSDMNA